MSDAEIIKCPPCMGLRSHALWLRRGTVAEPLVYFRQPQGVPDHVYLTLMESLDVLISPIAVKEIAGEMEGGDESG